MILPPNNLLHVALVTLPAVTVGLMAFFLDDLPQFAEDIWILAVCLGATASLVLHGFCFWNKSPNAGTRATLKAIARWCAVVTQALAIGGVFWLGVEIDGILGGLFFAIPLAVVIAACYGCMYLVGVVRQRRTDKPTIKHTASVPAAPLPASLLNKALWTLAAALLVLVLVGGMFFALWEADVMPEVIWSFQGSGRGFAVWPLLVWWLAVLVVPLVLLVALRRWLLCWRSQQLVAGLLVLATGWGLVMVFVDGQQVGGFLWKPTLHAEAYLEQALKEDLQHATGDKAEVLCGVLLEDAKRSERGYFFSPEPGLLFSVDLDILDVLSALEYDHRMIDKLESLVPEVCRAEVEARYPRP